MFHLIINISLEIKYSRFNIVNIRMDFQVFGSI